MRHGPVALMSHGFRAVVTPSRYTSGRYLEQTMRWKPALVVSILTSATMVSPLAAPSARPPSATSTCASPGERRRPANGLTAGDFVVREDDSAREVVRVSPAPPPLAHRAARRRQRRSMQADAGRRAVEPALVRRQHDRAADTADDVAHDTGGRPTSFVDFTRPVWSGSARASGGLFAISGTGT